MHLLSAKSGDGVALMFRMVVAHLTGIKVTKAEVDKLQTTVLTADVVDHADAPQRAVSHKKQAKGKPKSGVCSVQ